MTAISPLQNIHKKSLFGDHHKKNENNLLIIKEIKDLIIFQIVKYKKSTIKINDVQIDNLNLPLESLKVSSNPETRILWSGPGVWLVVSSKKNITNLIKDKCSSQNFAVTDISHSRAVIQICGNNAKEILKKGCPFNINEINKNNCVGTIFHGVTIVIDCIDDNPNKFNLLTLRSFGESFYHSVSDAALEDGYKGI